eukprot:m.111277 g.111277  ORF g.111277 m.111277 type:complete len:302 (-) comp15379_c0_seq6:64-969(-)
MSGAPSYRKVGWKPKRPAAKIAKNSALPSAKQSKLSKEHLCVYFTRTGKCRSGAKCRFIHDKAKLALCPRFLNNSCNGSCTLSHQIVDGNRPHCRYFQEDGCGNAKCPYAHVRVAGSAPFCPAFLAGWCDQGLSCTKRHVIACQAFLERRKCPHNDKCRYPHVKLASIRLPSQLAGATSASTELSSTASSHTGKSGHAQEAPTNARAATGPATLPATTTNTPTALKGLNKPRRASDIYISINLDDVPDTEDTFSPVDEAEQLDSELVLQLQRLGHALHSAATGLPQRASLPRLRSKTSHIA